MATQPPVIPVHIRGIDARLWRELRIEATRRIVPTADVLNEILREWLERRAASHAAPRKGDTTAGTP
jgi:hypothetical protein